MEHVVVFLHSPRHQICGRLAHHRATSADTGDGLFENGFHTRRTTHDHV